ncbi:hypothetical protein D8Y23_15300 [Microbacterium enclense]|uniref:Uncharacterized protein n=2 Tax=Microbacterium enclense TaxID=993073 RepID=A0A443J5S3_9MICO|nr:hypothetical protein D8Y23_15300 [Microbacterium enclense]
MGVFDAPGLSKRVGDSTYRRRSTPLPGAIVGTSYATALGSLVLSTPGTHDTPDVIATACSDLRVTYGSSYVSTSAQPYVDADNTNSITIQAAI